MTIEQKNKFMKLSGNGIIATLAFMFGLLGIHIWSKQCDKATAENKMVCENYIVKKIEDL